MLLPDFSELTMSELLTHPGFGFGCFGFGPFCLCRSYFGRSCFIHASFFDACFWALVLSILDCPSNLVLNLSPQGS
jgi:hypothetical protein